ncbi:MAG TPA: carbohydrate ABC transporter permease [Chloroflexota bacterium]|jgi:ABC-type glycerol-3-phosphate transport system permease component|nr:carbohydrate ABC transporter permease [Chloroflexota bacterium]
MAGSVAALGQARAASRARMLARARRGVLFYLLVFVLSCFFMGPFVWTVLSSLKDAHEIVTFPPTLFPAVPRFQNYPYAWNKVPFLRFYMNSAIVTGLAMVGQTLTATLVAYGFARFRFPLRNVLFMLVLSTLMIPWEVTIVPSFLLFKVLGWLDTLAPLIVPHWFGGGPFFIFLMRQFFLTIPRDYDEAAKIDGASSLRVLWDVLVPLCRPAITAVAIFSFLFHWNEFIAPLIYLNTPERFTISLGLRYFQTTPMEAGEPREHLLMAGTVIMAAPCVLLFFLAQRYFVRGIVLSGLKG